MPISSRPASHCHGSVRNSVFRNRLRNARVTSVRELSQLTCRASRIIMTSGSARGPAPVFRRCGSRWTDARVDFVALSLLPLVVLACLRPSGSAAATLRSPSSKTSRRTPHRRRIAMKRVDAAFGGRGRDRARGGGGDRRRSPGAIRRIRPRCRDRRSAAGAVDPRARRRAERAVRSRSSDRARRSPYALVGRRAARRRSRRARPRRRQRPGARRRFGGPSRRAAGGGATVAVLGSRRRRRLSAGARARWRATIARAGRGRQRARPGHAAAAHVLSAAQPDHQRAVARGGRRSRRARRAVRSSPRDARSSRAATCWRCPATC